MLDDLIELPEGWEETTLGDIVLSITYGHTASATDQPIGPKFLRITDLQNNSVNWENVPYCECKESEKYQLKAGDIVVARTGATTGKSYLIQDLPEPTVFASYLIRLQTSLLCSVEYLAIFMQSDNYWEQITTVSKGTAQPGANASILATLTIPLPPLNEQKRIVAKIEELRSHTQAARNTIAHIPKLLEQFRQSVLAAAFRGDLTAEWRSENPNHIVDEEFSEIEKDEKGWVFLKSTDACESVQSGSTPKGKPFTDTGDIPYLKVYNIVNQQINFDYKPQYVPLNVHQKELRRSITLPGDILMNIVGPPLGKIALVTDQFDEWNINQALVVFRTKYGLLNEYLYYFLREGTFVREIDNETKGSVGQVNISLTQCRQCIIPIPSRKEQIEILRQIQGMLSKIDRIEEQYQFIKTELDRLDRSILAKAFKGELVPQDPTDEPAIVLLERIRADRASQIKPAKTKRKKA